MKRAQVTVRLDMIQYIPEIHADAYLLGSGGFACCITTAKYFLDLWEI